MNKRQTKKLYYKYGKKTYLEARRSCAQDFWYQLYDYIKGDRDDEIEMQFTFNKNIKYAHRIVFIIRERDLKITVNPKLFNKVYKKERQINFK